MTVGSDANKYTYNDANSRNIEIENGGFMDGADTDYFDTEKNEATMVFIRAVEDEVVDIYSFNERVTVKADGTVNGATTLVIKGKDASATTFSTTPAKAEVAAPAEDAVVTEKDAETVEID